MVISIDTYLIKQLVEQLNIILAISIIARQDERWIKFYFPDSVILTHIATPTWVGFDSSSMVREISLF